MHVHYLSPPINMKCKTMSLLHSFQTKRQDKMKSLYMDVFGFQGGDDSQFVILKLHNLWVLKLMAQAVILALVIVSFPWINTIIRDVTWSYGYNYVPKVDEMARYNNPIKLDVLPLMFHDLANEGLLRIGDRSLLITNGNEEAIYNSQVTSDYNMDLISFSNLARQKSDVILEETFDFIILPYGFSKSLNIIDRALKVGGVIAIQLINGNVPMANKFPQPSNYKVVYVRKFDATIVVMRKTSKFVLSTSHHRKLFNIIGPNNAKEAALKKLEDVLLEPPRAASGKSSTYLKKTRYLPDLMNIPLESYPRRVFIDVGIIQDKNEAPGDSSWFSKHYPTKNTKFEIVKIETVTNNKESSSGNNYHETPILIGMSDWLKKNVKENEYVVMKAEAEVVEEMVRNKAIKLVDELFLECKHKGVKKGDKKSRRAYWECLSLYGMLRDEGVAVHQWWG